MKVVAAACAAVLVGLSLLAGQASGSPSRLRLDQWLDGPESILLTAEERRLIETLGDADEVDRFVAWFWSRRDPDTSTAVNEFRPIFGARVARARKLYDRGPVPGWRTAPGLLQVLFGEPHRTYSGGRVFDGGSFREVTVWEYVDPRDGRSPIPFFLIDADRGLEFAVGDESGASAAQPAMIEVARRALIRDRADFGTTARNLGASNLPASGTAVRVAGGVLVHLTLELGELLGAPVHDGIVYTFDTVVDTPTGSQRLGVVQARVRHDQIADHRDRDLQLVGWFPFGDADGVTLRVTELPAARTLILPVGADGAVPRRFEIAREICVTDLMQGAGAFVAFFGTNDREPVPVAVLHAATDAGGLPIADSRLYLDRLAADQER